jgi:PhoPQ-activated pathogenicity-related protein
MGITIPSDTLNKQKALVLINGITYSENDEVSGYLIEKITKEGVSFKKNGQRFFVDAPEILYSVDQGD